MLSPYELRETEGADIYCNNPEGAALLQMPLHVTKFILCDWHALFSWRLKSYSSTSIISDTSLFFQPVGTLQKSAELVSKQCPETGSRYERN
jgi:hypothetical protein